MRTRRKNYERAAGCRLFLTADQAIAANTPTTLSGALGLSSLSWWRGESAIPLLGVANGSGIIQIAERGLYDIRGQVQYASNASASNISTFAQHIIGKTGVSSGLGPSDQRTTDAGSSGIAILSSIAECEAGDWVQLRVITTVARNVQNTATWLSVLKISD